MLKKRNIGQLLQMLLFFWVSFVITDPLWAQEEAQERPDAANGDPIVDMETEDTGLFSLRVLQVNAIYYNLDYFEEVQNNFSGEGISDNRTGTDAGSLVGVQIRSRLDFTFPLSLLLFAEYSPDIWSGTEADLWRYNDNLVLSAADDSLETTNRRIGFYFELGTRLPLVEIMAEPLILNLSLGFGYRNWERRFLAADNFQEYRTVLSNWYQPYTVGLEWQISRLRLGVFGSLINNFRTSMIVVFRDIDAGSNTDNVDLPLLLPNAFDYKVEAPLRFMFSEQQRKDSFFDFHSIVVTPFWERVSTGQSNWHYTYTKAPGAEDAESNRHNTRTIQQWASMSTLVGATIGMELRF